MNSKLANVAVKAMDKKAEDSTAVKKQIAAMIADTLAANGELTLAYNAIADIKTLAARNNMDTEKLKEILNMLLEIDDILSIYQEYILK